MIARRFLGEFTEQRHAVAQGTEQMTEQTCSPATGVAPPQKSRCAAGAGAGANVEALHRRERVL